MLWELTGQKIQFKIYALFLLADGQWRDEEQNFLNTISKEMELDESVQREVMREVTTYCQGVEITKGDHSDGIIREIDKMLTGGFASRFKDDPRLQVEIVWTLINLGYADQEYSEAEKRVVRHLIEKWEIKPEIALEFTDTAETILLLTKHENWSKSVGLPYDETKKRLETVEQQIQLMFDNIQATISEADAV